MFDVQFARQQFPALTLVRNGLAPVFLDGPGGTQVPKRVIEAMVHYLTHCNANHGGVFATSRESDEILAQAHQGMANLLNARSPREIVFGANMTTLTLHLSRSIGKRLRAGDEVIVTRMDHDANVTPWILAARDAKAEVRWVDVRPEDGTLDMDDLRRQLNPRTRLVAVACASNAIGTINDIATIVRIAHAAGAMVFVDAVHFAPHGPIDVQAWNCDFLACSSYKFFGPHVGVLWAKEQHLKELEPYKLRPVPESLPDRWMTGTQNHEGLAGVAAAIDYLMDLGRKHTAYQVAFTNITGRSLLIHGAMAAIQAYEAQLGRQLLDALAQRPRFKVWGIADRERLAERVPTISLTMPDRPAAAIAEHLAARGIYVWHGNMYALGLAERLAVEGSGGFLRIGLVHYNTEAEVDRLVEALDELK